MNNKDKNFVLCELPKAGLGNMLFPLMKAFVFGHLNNLPVCVIGYHRIQLGPYIRAEKSKRRYVRNFTFQKSFFGELADLVRFKHVRNYEIVDEPALNRVEYNTTKRSLYRFHSIPHWADYFDGLRQHRPLVIKMLRTIVRPEIMERTKTFPSPVIGVHIRMGDFRTLRPEENFSKVGTVRTPEKYFIEVIKNIRDVCGKRLPVSIFTDGHKHEFNNLLSMGDISIIEGNKDIEDMLLLSRSKIIVTSAGSTFGYWSGFLSEAPIILHPDHIHQPIRNSNFFEKYEGPLEISNNYLKEAIESFTDR